MMRARKLLDARAGVIDHHADSGFVGVSRRGGEGEESFWWSSSWRKPSTNARPLQLIAHRVDELFMAKGGIVFAIADALKLPLRFIGVGEQQDDLQTFSAANFVDALLGSTEADSD